MGRTNVQRVYLGAPYDKEMWWNTARRIINESHRGTFDYRFIRHQPLPDGARKGGYLVGGAGTGHVLLKQVKSYKEVERETAFQSTIPRH